MQFHFHVWSPTAIGLAGMNLMSNRNYLQPVAALSGNVIADARARHESLGPSFVATLVTIGPTAVATHDKTL